MRRMVAALVLTCSAWNSAAADAQFAAPNGRFKPSTNATRRAAPQTSWDRQRRWVVDATRRAMTKVDFLPRGAPVKAEVQQAVTAFAPAATARAWDSGDCERSISMAETEYGLPPYLLAAIALTESGREGRPSPLAMNIGGRPYFASSTQEMEQVVLRNGGDRSSIDVGCTQINLRWHAGRFKDWRSLLIPIYNAEYAALYLRDLRRQKGSWTAAVGAYHSNTPWRSANYACLVSRNWSQIFGWSRPGCGADIEAMSSLMYTTRQAG